ncbi:hypothetical protein FVEG_10631 [Fusarium verticillioides 7600]|uniref:Uncharacterized protein n=1 Tax=Gibberella moniliformis (strain M3125 / FGSC 7600) TaxID=334819 RepID=W7MVL3_GIBM7|nr:hypothetical protein FVEG_10631 [Fusarium verticillioides 7600]EWG51740.1 hypothetical protein FVEG_10631 [Fusarium verticillioides 7600]
MAIPPSELGQSGNQTALSVSRNSSRFLGYINAANLTPVYQREILREWAPYSNRNNAWGRQPENYVDVEHGVVRKWEGQQTEGL